MTPTTACMTKVEAVTASMSRLESNLFDDAANDSFFPPSTSLSFVLSGGASPISPAMAAAFANTIAEARRNVRRLPSLSNIKPPMRGPHSSPKARPVSARPIADPRTSGGCVSAISVIPPHITAADAAPCAPLANRSWRKVVASEKTSVARPNPAVDAISAAFAEVLDVRTPATGANAIWHRSLLAKNTPSATSLFVVTPRGGGLDTSVWMMGRSIVS
mmetsp:Transcript_11011/g.23876  ORF Transcript_11011/g.23876 Transcript_11011/m.23876 type:complete len:218 (-) Transcript_11011:392-1045(-)